MGKVLQQERHFLKGSTADKRGLPVTMKLSNRPYPVGLKRCNGAAMAEQIVVGDDQQQRRRCRHRCRHRCRRAGPHNTFIALSNNDSSEG